MNERKKESALERQRRLVATLPQTPEQVARLTPCAALGKGAKPVWCGHCRQTVMPGDACASGVLGRQPTALERFNRDPDLLANETPLERLRYFLSIALNGQDWLDVEPFLDALGVPAVDEAQAKRLSDALRAMQEMWDHLRRKGLNDVLMREYSNALEVLEADFRERLPDGVEGRHG